MAGIPTLLILLEEATKRVSYQIERNKRLDHYDITTKEGLDKAEEAIIAWEKETYDILSEIFDTREIADGFRAAAAMYNDLGTGYREKLTLIGGRIEYKKQYLQALLKQLPEFHTNIPSSPVPEERTYDRDYVRDERIPNYQREQVEQAIIDRGMDLSQFEWTVVESDWKDTRLIAQYDTRRLIPNAKVSKLCYKNTQYYCTFDVYGENGLYSERRPGADRTVEPKSFSRWDDRKAYVLEWLDILQKELNARDLMAEFTRSRALFETSIAARVPNIPLSPEERSVVLSRLDEVEGQLAKLVEAEELSPHQTQELQNQIKQDIGYVKDASQRLGRKDLTLLTLGTGISIIINAMFSPEVRPIIFRYFVDLVNYITSGHIYLPPT
jgi:hypothetical protein